MTDESTFPALVRSCIRPAGWFEDEALPITPEACEAAIRLVAMARSEDPSVPLPRAEPSLLGGVPLHWAAHDESLMILVEGGPEEPVYFEWEGPGGRESHGYELTDIAITRLIAHIKGLTLAIEIEVPEHTTDADIIRMVGELVLHADGIHRVNGGHGLKVDRVEITEGGAAQ